MEERHLHDLVDGVPGHLWRLSPAGEPDFFSKRMSDFIGRAVEDLSKPGASRLEAMIDLAIHPDDRAKFKSALDRSLRTGSDFAMRYRLRRFDGVYHWMSSRAEAQRDQDGRIANWFGTCHDIDDQVGLEEAFQRSERHLQKLIDAMPVHVCSWTPDGTLSYVTKR